MFQTEIVIYVQSFSSEFLNLFFLLITGLGYESFIKPFIIIIIFGVSYRKGFLLLHLVLWTGIITELLKELFALPRPSHVDSAVQLPGKELKNPTILKGMGAKSFFGCLPPEAVEYIRSTRSDSFGFPSGHTSGAVALWGGLAVLFKNKIVILFSSILILLIPLSRIYLGRHFLADILGGYLVGVIFLIIFYKYIFFNHTFGRHFFNIPRNAEINLVTILLIIYFFVVPPILLMIPQIDMRMSALLLGLNLGYFFVWLKGIPDCSAPMRIRILRVVIAIIIFIMITQTAKWMGKFILPAESAIFSYLFEALVMGLMIWISTEVIIKLKFMSR